MPALKIDRFFSAEGDFQPVFEKMRQIEALSKLLEGFLPPELAPLARVANFKDGKLVILAANGAAAAKLKLLSESLGTYITQQRTQVNSVSVRVQLGGDEGGDEGGDAVPKQARLTHPALQELAALYQRLPESAFRKALKTLLDRHGLTP
jgi:hypothetical protein